MSVAESIVQEDDPDPILIENEIALSIGIRHLAENYMYNKIISTGKSEEELVVNGNRQGNGQDYIRNVVLMMKTR